MVDTNVFKPNETPAAKDRSNEVAKPSEPGNSGIEKPNVDLTSKEDCCIAKDACCPDKNLANKVVGCCEIEGCCDKMQEAQKLESERIEKAGEVKSSGRDEAHDRLLDMMKPLLGDPRTARLAEMMNGFEKRMDDSVERRAAVGDDKDKVQAEVNSKVQGTYDYLTQMVTNNNPEAPFDKAARAAVAESFMYHAMDPETVNGGSFNTSGWLEPAYVTSGFNKAPDQLARVLQEATTTGSIKDATSERKFTLPTHLLNLDRRNRGKGWSVSNAEHDGSQASPAAYILDATMSNIVRLRPESAGAVSHTDGAMKGATGEKSVIINNLYSEKNREALVREGAAMRPMPAHFGTWGLHKAEDGNGWMLSRGDQYDNRDRHTNRIADLKQWIKDGRAEAVNEAHKGPVFRSAPDAFMGNTKTDVKPPVFTRRFFQLEK